MLFESAGIVKSDFAHQKWNEHLSGKRNLSSKLWGFLMLYSWYEAEK